MDIEKCIGLNWFFYYYLDDKTDSRITHGLYRSTWWGIGYHYHDEIKGFYLKRLK